MGRRKNPPSESANQWGAASRVVPFRASLADQAAINAAILAAQKRSKGKHVVSVSDVIRMGIYAVLLACNNKHGRVYYGSFVAAVAGMKLEPEHFEEPQS